MCLKSKFEDLKLWSYFNPTAIFKNDVDWQHKMYFFEIIWATSRENLFLGFATRVDSNRSAQS